MRTEDKQPLVIALKRRLGLKDASREFLFGDHQLFFGEVEYPIVDIVVPLKGLHYHLALQFRKLPGNAFEVLPVSINILSAEG